MDFALVYIQPVNGLLKRAIEKGKLSYPAPVQTFMHLFYPCSRADGRVVV